jgi:hypothetical protein
VTATPATTPSETTTLTTTGTPTATASATHSVTASPTGTVTRTQTRTATPSGTITTTVTATTSRTATVTTTQTPVQFAMMGLEPNISSVRINGGSDTDIGANGSIGNTCTAGQLDASSLGNNTTQIHGEVHANQGFFGQPPPSPAINVVPGIPCTDPGYTLPSPRPPFPSSVAWWSETVNHQGTSCAALCTLELCNGGGCSGTTKYTTPTVASNVNDRDVFLCPDNSDPLMTINDVYYANIIVSCRSGNTGKIAIENPRLLVDVSRTTQGIIELRGPSSSSITGCTGCTQNVAVFQSVYSSNSLTSGNDGLVLSGGYYDTIAAGGGNVFFKDGQYLISRGFDSRGVVNGCSVVNSAVIGAPCANTSSRVSIVVGLLWNTSNNAVTTLTCCADSASSTQWPTAYRPTSPANTNNILIYHLGGCRSPYVNSTPTSSGQAIFPIWPGWTNIQCAVPASTGSVNLGFTSGSGSITLSNVRSYLSSMTIYNQVNTQGGNNNTWGGSLYSPYQCYPSPTGCGATGSALPQFACATPACIVIGGSSGSTYTGQIIAPSILVNGGGAGVIFSGAGASSAAAAHVDWATRLQSYIEQAGLGILRLVAG